MKPFLNRPTHSPLFSPREADAERRAKEHDERKTPLNHGNRPGTNRVPEPVRKPAERYSVSSYRQAIHRGCDRAFPPPKPLAKREKETNAEWTERLTDEQHEELKRWRSEHRWSPHQLRHSAATRIRKEFGLEAAQVLLGHSSIGISEIYAMADEAKAIEVVKKIG